MKNLIVYMGLLKAFAGLLQPFSREGSLSCHTCFDTGPRFSRTHQKDRPVFFATYDNPPVPRTYSSPDHQIKQPYKQTMI